MSDLANPYRYQRERMQQILDDAESLKRGLESEREALPDLQRECESNVFPMFENWAADLRRAIQPITKVKDLRRRAKSMRGLMRLVLSNGQALRTLITNAFLRLAILLVFVLKLALLAGIIWGAIRLANFLSERF